MEKPKYPGALLEKMHKHQMKSKHHKSKVHHKMYKHHKLSSLTGLKEGSPTDMKMDEALAEKMHGKAHAHLHKMASHLHKHAMHSGMDGHLKKVAHHLHKALKHMKPKGKAGRAQVKKLGRTFKTGGFAKIAKAAGKKYGSKEAGKRVAGSIFQHMAAKHAAK